MEINAEAVDAVRKQLGQSITELVINAKDEYERMARLMKISAHVEKIVLGALPLTLAKNDLPESPPNLRATVHVQDIVFPEYLYQFVDYFPTRDGSGRRFPQRYGIIGRSWRLGESIGEGNAFDAGKGEERTLVEEWGMTREDVRIRGRNRPAYLAIVLRGIIDDDFPLGILYLDSTEPGVFGDDKKATEIAQIIEASPEARSLRGALEKALAPLRVAAPNIDITKLSR